MGSVSDIWACPYCEHIPRNEYNLQIHIRNDHKEYGTAGRCQAYLLTPSARKWNKYTGSGMRCKFSAKSLVMPFCGNHMKLAEFIEEIVWKES